MSVNPWDGGFPEALCGLSWLTYVAGQSVDSSLSLRQLGFVVLTSALPPPCCLQLLTPPHTRMHACTHARMHTRTHVRQRPAAVQCEPDGFHPVVHLGTVAAAVPGAEWKPAVWHGPTHPVAADGLEVHVEPSAPPFFVVTTREKATWNDDAPAVTAVLYHPCAAYCPCVTTTCRAHCRVMCPPCGRRRGSTTTASPALPTSVDERRVRPRPTLPHAHCATCSTAQAVPGGEFKATGWPVTRALTAGTA